MYDSGEGVKEDNFKAIELYQKACDGGASNGCSNLRIMHYEGQSVKKDKLKELELLGKACDMKSESRCEKLRSIETRTREIKKVVLYQTLILKNYKEALEKCSAIKHPMRCLC